MDPRGNPQKSAHRGAIFLVWLMLFSVLPILAPNAAAAPSINLNVSPNSMEVNPGESGEYTVVVYNTGSDPVSVNLQANNEPGEDCNGYTTTILKIPVQIEAGSSEETTMNVKSRSLLKVLPLDEGNTIVSELMGDDVEPRRRFIQTNALEAKNIDIA